MLLLATGASGMGTSTVRRLVERGDPAELLPNHLAFADSMREHVVDPRHRPEVLRTHAWDAMRWERLYGPDADPSPWTVHRIDTTGREPRAVADEVADWIRDALDAAPR